jgi:hypothetical protein
MTLVKHAGEYYHAVMHKMKYDEDHEMMSLMSLKCQAGGYSFEIDFEVEGYGSANRIKP